MVRVEQGIQVQALVGIQERDDDSLDRCSCGRGGKKWLDSGYIF